MATYSKMSRETLDAAWFLARGIFQRRLLLGYEDWDCYIGKDRVQLQYQRSRVALLRRLLTHGFNVRFVLTKDGGAYIITSRLTGR